MQPLTEQTKPPLTSTEATKLTTKICGYCGNRGHPYYQCKYPITSYGMVVFRIRPETSTREYLMICRKDTLGYIDFVRGKYNPHDYDYVMNMLKQMTTGEKQNIVEGKFMECWQQTSWSSHSSQYTYEEFHSKTKYEILKQGYFHPEKKWTTLESMIADNDRQYPVWTEPEWGFPKGRKNHNEKDLSCAFREFTEETGCSYKILRLIQNIFPFEEIFIGSNYKSYKHKYYLAQVPYDYSTTPFVFQQSEVSQLKWKSFEEATKSIRDYNVEKKNMLFQIEYTLNHYTICET
jgi:8-oxo-dGTP pyrophosphatase MutT (NUDIX family)